VHDSKVLVEFLAHRLDSDARIIILGDHQPSQKITGSDQPWSFPVHVIGRNSISTNLSPKKGYTPARIPSQASPHMRIEIVLWKTCSRNSVNYHNEYLKGTAIILSSSLV
jgi:hypothetical protein